MHLYMRPAFLSTTPDSISDDGAGTLLCHFSVCRGKAFGSCLPAKLGSAQRCNIFVALSGYQQEVSALCHYVHWTISCDYNGHILNCWLYANGIVPCLWINHLPYISIRQINSIYQGFVQSFSYCNNNFKLCKNLFRTFSFFTFVFYVLLNKRNKWILYKIFHFWVDRLNFVKNLVLESIL